MSGSERVGSGVGGGVRRWSVLAGALAATVVLVSLHLLGRSNYLLFHSIIEALERGYYRSDWERVAGSLDHGSGPGTVMGFIAGVPSLSGWCAGGAAGTGERHCLKQRLPGNAACGGRRNERNEAENQRYEKSMAMAD